MASTRMHSKVITRDKLAPLLADHRRRKQAIVFTNGCFDLMHIGHTRYLQAARNLGDLLVVGVNSDESVRALSKGCRPPYRAGGSTGRNPRRIGLRRLCGDFSGARSRIAHRSPPAGYSREGRRLAVGSDRGPGNGRSPRRTCANHSARSRRLDDDAGTTDSFHHSLRTSCRLSRHCISPTGSPLCGKPFSTGSGKPCLMGLHGSTAGFGLALLTQSAPNQPLAERSWLVVAKTDDEAERLYGDTLFFRTLCGLIRRRSGALPQVGNPAL